MRLRHANIRLINRRSNLPRLLLALSSINGQCNDNSKNNPTDAQGLTGHSISDLVLRFLGYWLTPLARKPPSTTKIWPVTNEALSEAR